MPSTSSTSSSRVWKAGNVLAVGRQSAAPLASVLTSPALTPPRPSIPMVRVAKVPANKVRPLVLPAHSTSSPEGVHAAALAAERSAKRVGHVRLYQDEERTWVDSMPWFLRKRVEAASMGSDDTVEGLGGNMMSAASISPFSRRPPPPPMTEERTRLVA